MGKIKPKNTSIHPQLIRVVLAGINIQQTFPLVKPSIAKNKGKTQKLILEKKISLETFPPDERLKQIRLLVTIELLINCLSDDSSLPPLISANSTYQGRFLFPSGISINQADNYLSIDSNKYLLASQVTPVAMTHIKSQLQMFGLSTNSVPIGEEFQFEG